MRTPPLAIKLGLLAVLAAAALMVGVTLLDSTPQSAEAGTSPAISLRVTNTVSCGGVIPGEVCVTNRSKFNVIAVADAIPASGYIFVGAWIDYDNTGLVHKNSTVALWPDCNAAFLPTESPANNGAAAGCLTGIVPPIPTSFHVGDLYSFSLTCDTDNSHTINLLPEGDPIAGTNGTLFKETITTSVIPALTGIIVNCVVPPHEFPTDTPTSTPPPTNTPDPTDTDGDGCSDQRENGSDETQGGLRNYLDPNDYYDVLGPFGSLTLDGVIDLPNDILGVILHFAPQGQPPYDVRFDRGVTIGANHWERDAPDGVIDLPNDILGVILQFGHNCV